MNQLYTLNFYLKPRHFFIQLLHKYAKDLSLLVFLQLGCAYSRSPCILVQEATLFELTSTVIKKQVDLIGWMLVVHLIK